MNPHMSTILKEVKTVHLRQFACVVVSTLADGQRGVDGEDAAVRDVHFGK